MKYINIFENEEGLRAFFSTKAGSVVGAPYNNEEVFQELSLSEVIKVFPKQIHSPNIEVIRAEDVKDKREVTVTDTDGTITDVTGVLLTTVHADCLPVYFYDPVKRVIAMVHSGWRGTVSGIASKTISIMASEFGCEPSEIKVYIGPGISKCCFQVGSEVVEAFEKNWGYSYSVPDDVEGKFRIDLKSIVKRQLIDAGVLENKIGVSSHCTCCESETFASYRREGGTYLRMGAGICMI